MKSPTKIRLTKSFSFEMAHALPGYDGACKNIHGHSYRLKVTIAGSPMRQSGHPKDGMVMDFKVLKNIVKVQIEDVFDHALVLPESSSGELVSMLQERFENVVLTPFQPTCENLLLHFIGKIRPELSPEVELKVVRLYETAASYAEWNAEDNEQ
ncbi:MAG: 6-carboxytetrahydropterin synthase [Saprospiraceae bacterium]|nr:MAG: 6-carboxytetrahydropterin synthase [Saprospiraceae bacterium]